MCLKEKKKIEENHEVISRLMLSCPLNHFPGTQADERKYLSRCHNFLYGISENLYSGFSDGGKKNPNKTLFSISVSQKSNLQLFTFSISLKCQDHIYFIFCIFSLIISQAFPMFLNTLLKYYNSFELFFQLSVSYFV